MMRTLRLAGARPRSASVFLLEQLLALNWRDRRLNRLAGGTLRSRELREDVHHSMQRADHVGFGAAERGKSQGSELLLQLANVVAAKCQIVEQVSGARTVLRMNIRFIRQALSLQIQHFRTQQIQLMDQVMQSS